MTIPRYTGDIPYLTTNQMIEVDRLMIDEYGITLMQMMESAGRNLAHLARERFFNGDPVGRRVVVLAGTGGNGGGALVCARRLHNYGADVTVFTVKADADFKAVPHHQLAILRRMGVTIVPADEIPGTQAVDLVIDGVIGYSLQGDPRGGAATLIAWANGAGAPVLSLDAPSGIDATSGTVYDLAITATATMTLALPKIGLRAVPVGELYLADISVPPELYAEPSLGINVGHLFAQGDILRL